MSAAVYWVLPYGKQEVYRLIDKFSVSVLSDELTMEDTWGYCSEYNKSRREIVLHTGSLRQWAYSEEMSYEDILTIAISHELFHHLECSSEIDIWQSLRENGVELKGLGRRNRSRGIIEACAHGFASTVVFGA